MPIYEYQCESCGHQMEALQKMSDPLLTDCPECKAVALKKKISAAAFRLKGGGWYETDFKTGNKKNVAGEKGSGKSGDSSSATKSPDSGGDKSKSSSDSKTSTTKTDSKAS